MLAMVLQSVGLPVEGIALVAGIDRIFDMGRTTVNITGDAACTLCVSKMEETVLNIRFLDVTEKGDILFLQKNNNSSTVIR